MADHPTPDWIGPALGAGGTAVAAVLAWLGVRFTAKASKPDPQAIQNDGWESLLGQMRRELIAASRERNALKAHLEEREAAWALERVALEGRIAQLQAVAEGFERLLRRNGIELPPRRAYEPMAPQIVETTLRQEGLGDDE